MLPKPLILNVDDDEPGRYAVSRTLRQAGFEVAEAATGEGGLRMAQSKPPDLILLDIRLPDIDGFEVCRRIRALPEIAHTPVIQMSASYLDTSSQVKGLENGADAYLTEPTEPSILIATVNSVLRMKRAEQTLLKSAQMWQSTFEAIGDGVAVLDGDGKVVQANGAFQATPLHRSQDGGKSVTALFAQLRRERTRQTEELRIGDKSLLITLDPTFGNSRELTGAVCIVSDVTEKRSLEQQLRQAARLESIGVLAGGIAHDFNNLLTGILGNSSLLLDTLPRQSHDRELVEEIVKASESAADLTKQILAYSGKGRFVMRALDLGAIALEVRSFVKRFIPSKVELLLDFAPNLPQVEGDAGQIKQLMMNLIINAAESFRDNEAGHVRVSTGTECLESDFFRPNEPVAPGCYVVLTVSDTGSGMDQKTQEHIFDPFFTTKFTGRGLGLSAVRGIVQGHKGLLRLQSRLGEGTTFSLYLPVALPKPDPAISADSAVLREKAEGTILVADDEAIVRDLAKAVLERIGYQVLLAQDGEQCVQIFRERHRELALVLLDLTMPVMSGEEALAELTGVRTDVPIVLSSGYSRAAAEELFHGKGLTAFLSKPYTAQGLAEIVGAVLNGRGRLSSS